MAASRTRVVNRSKPHDEYIGRPTCFGNPFPITEDEGRSVVIAKYRVYFYERFVTDESFRSAVLDLMGKSLGCFCSPLRCHGDVIAEFLNLLAEILES